MAAADRIIFGLGRRQHGVVAGWQLMEMGVSQREIQRRVADRRLRVIHRGVYAMGPLTRRGAWLAAVLACGRGAVLSHRDAAALHNLRPCNRSSVEVTVTRRLRKRRRIDVHRTRSLPDRDQTIVDGIPVTSVARTLLDLAEVVPTDHLRRAYEAAERHGLLDMHAVHELVARSNGRRGLSALLALLDYDPREAVESKSDLESRFLDLVR